jgi:predicted transcriptional regulator
MAVRARDIFPNDTVAAAFDFVALNSPTTKRELTKYLNENNLKDEPASTIVSYFKTNGIILEVKGKLEVTEDGKRAYASFKSGGHEFKHPERISEFRLDE